MADLFKKGEYERLAFFTLPYPHPILQLLRKGACIVEDRYFDISGWRVKLINLSSTLGKLAPLFETRLAESQFAGWTCSLLIDAGEQKATRKIKDGTVAVSSASSAANSLHGGADVARLLIGSDEPDELVRQEGLECRGLASDLAGVLFPNLHPMMSHWDEF